MKIGRIVLIVAVVALIAIAGALIYVATNINSIVEAAIERYGTQAAGTEVSVSSVDIRLSSARGTVNGLSVANPPGFSESDIFRLGSISIRIDTRSVTETPIVINDIRISGTEVFYEINSSGASNLDVFRKHIEETAKEKPPKEEKEKEVRLHIRKLTFEKGRIEARLPGIEDPVTVNLPRVTLADIGKNGGATPGQIAATLVKALAEASVKAVSGSQIEQLKKKGVEELREGAEELDEGVRKSAEDLLKQLK